MRQKFIIITKCANLLLHSATSFYAKCDNCYYKVRQLVLQSAMTFKRCDRTQRSTLQNHNVFAIEAVRVNKGYTCNLSPLLFTLPIPNTLKTVYGNLRKTLTRYIPLTKKLDLDSNVSSSVSVKLGDNPQVPSSIVCICDERRTHSNISNDLTVN